MTPPFSPPDPVVPAAPLAPPLVSVASEGPTQPRASWVHTPWGRDSYQETLYQAGVPVGSRPVGAQVDGASFSALTPGTEYEVQVVAQAGPLRVATAGASGWICEPHWNGRGRSSGQGRPWTPAPSLGGTAAPQSPVPPAPRGPCVGSQASCSPPHSLTGAHQAAGVHAGGQCCGQPGLGQRPPGARSVPHTPGLSLSLSVLCQAGPLQASTHLVLQPVGTSVSLRGNRAP